MERIKTKKESSLKGKIIANVRLYKANDETRLKKIEAKRRRIETFNSWYDKTIDWNSKSINETNMEKHFYMFNEFIKFNYISLSAIAIYPCLCSQANFEKDEWFHISEQNIAKMAGISINSVIAGIKNMIDNRFTVNIPDKNDEDEVIDVPLLQRKMFNDGKRHFYKYKVCFVRKSMMENWTFLIFHTCIIDSGVWAKLEPRAKALYLAMRSEAKFNGKLYCQIEGIQYNEQEWYDEGFRNRKWDICETSLAELCRKVGSGFDDVGNIKGISSSNIQIVVKQLEHYGLVEQINSRFMVYLKPKNGNDYE
jgi:hypothetical protein